MTTKDLLRMKKDEIIRIAARHGARNIRVFGSVARGEETADSDIDFLVDMDSGKGLLNHAALALELQKALGREVDVATIKGLRPRILEHVLREAVFL